MLWLIYILGVLFVIFSLIKFLNVDHWTVRFFDFPQLQFLGLGILVIILSVWKLDLSGPYNWFFLLVIGIVAIYQTTLILPYTPFYKKQVVKTDADPDIKILVSNVYQPNEEYNRLLKLIDECDPDIIFMVETNNRWKENTLHLQRQYPYHLYHTIDNMYGLIFYSRFELKNEEVRFLIKDDIPSVKTEIILENGKEILFYGMHPEPPSPTENYRSTERDAELYLLAKEIAEIDDKPIIVAGDLNDVAWSKSTRIFQRISGLLDPRKGRGSFNTFHAKYPIRWPLDHIFNSQHFSLCEISTLDKIGSDHFPMFIALHLDYFNGNGDAEDATEEDHEEANEKISEATKS